MHHTPASAAVHALGELRRLHNVAWIDADVAIDEAYSLLERFDALEEFLSWADVNGARRGYWPHQARVAAA